MARDGTLQFRIHLRDNYATPVRATYIIALALLVCWLPNWSQEQKPQSNTPRGSGTPRPSSTNGGRAPDGDTYKPPVSVVHTPKTHPAATNPGRPPAEKQGGDTGAIIGGAAAAGGLVALGTWMHERNKPEVKLSRDGPKIPDQFNMSGFSIAAFCRADWPVAVDYMLANGGELSIVVTAEGVAPFHNRIRRTGARQQEIFRLPSYFPVRPSPGVYTISATTGGPGVATPVYLRLFGVGGGERAVGSVAIDQVIFEPDTIHPKQNQQARYAFHAHTDFDRVRAEFLKAFTAQGQIVSKLEDHDDINDGAGDAGNDDDAHNRAPGSRARQRAVRVESDVGLGVRTSRRRGLVAAGMEIGRAHV